MKKLDKLDIERDLAFAEEVRKWFADMDDAEKKKQQQCTSNRRRYNFVPSWQRRYGLEITKRDPLTQAPLEVRCRFCLNLEEKLMNLHCEKEK